MFVKELSHVGSIFLETGISKVDAQMRNISSASYELITPFYRVGTEGKVTVRL